MISAEIILSREQAGKKDLIQKLTYSSGMLSGDHILGAETPLRSITSS